MERRSGCQRNVQTFGVIYPLRQLRTHANNSAPVVQNDAVTLQAVSALPNDHGDTLIEGVTEGNVGDNTALKEGPWANTLGAVNDLIGDHEVAGLNGLLQTADGGESDDAADSNGAQSSDVGASGHLVRGNLVVGAVAAQERDGDGLVVVLALVVENGDRGGRLTPGGRNVQRSNLGESRELAKASAADNSN